LSLAADAVVSDLAVKGKPLGRVTASATTHAGELEVKLATQVRGADIAGTGRWRLAANYPGSGEVRFTNVSLAAARDWLSAGSLDVDGTVEGFVRVSGPALDPGAWKATAEITKLEVRSPTEKRVSLQNDGPIRVSLDGSVVRVAKARLTGPQTTLEVSGTASIEPRQALDLRVTGGINLAVIKDFYQELDASGTLSLNTTVRGTPRDPQVNGRLELKDATLAVIDLPNGLSNASGVILLNGNRATIEELRAETGGGKVRVGGFAEIGGAEPAFRLEIKAAQVRVRYPEGASTSADASLVMAGTTRRSTLSGVVTILRTGFNPRTDFSSLLAKSAEPARTPSARTGMLAGIQLDVRIETAPNIIFESAMATDMHAEGSVQLRGNPYAPALLGRVSITQGEITFFGTKYTINQGTISFVNPVKIEPILNLDLETKARGVDIILTLSGPINKLSVVHRADPPLEFAEVVALLATGRAPSSDPTLSARQSAQPQSFTQLGASALVGQAIASPLASRLQRFFGVSRLKIDPSL
ncbi:MAG: translocation/assembly module TamB domain-containing protein, partial [Bryobacteraceae bacterium]